MRFLVLRLLAFLPAAVSLDAAVTFRLHDPLAHPFIWWPRTLLEYPVNFDPPVATGELILRDEHDTAVPFQLSHIQSRNGKIVSATVCFFSDLPSGGTHTFVLKEGAPSQFP